MSENANARTAGKWTDELAEQAVARYNELTESGKSAPEAVEEIADEMGRTKRSVQGKLTSMQVYVAPEKKPAKKKDEGPTKGEILTAIADTGFDVTGLETATKPALERVRDFVVSARTSD
jgi:hypothetical protein